MKSHISATIDRPLVSALHRLRRRERRSLSDIIEAAVAKYIDEHEPAEQIVTSAGSFQGRFSRAETYARTRR